MEYCSLGIDLGFKRLEFNFWTTCLFLVFSTHVHKRQRTEFPCLRRLLCPTALKVLSRHPHQSQKKDLHKVQWHQDQPYISVNLTAIMPPTEYLYNMVTTICYILNIHVMMRCVFQTDKDILCKQFIRYRLYLRQLKLFNITTELYHSLWTFSFTKVFENFPLTSIDARTGPRAGNEEIYCIQMKLQWEIR